MVDFNHPLAGKDLVYDVRINRTVDDDSEKLKSLLKIHIKIKDAEVELKEGLAEIKLKEKIPVQAQDEFKKIAEKAIPNIKKVDFTILEERK